MRARRSTTAAAPRPPSCPRSRRRCSGSASGSRACTSTCAGTGRRSPSWSARATRSPTSTRSCTAAACRWRSWACPDCCTCRRSRTWWRCSRSSTIRPRTPRWCACWPDRAGASARGTWRCSAGAPANWSGFRGTGASGALDQALVGSDPTEVVSLADALADPGAELPFSQAARSRFERFAAEIQEGCDVRWPSRWWTCCTGSCRRPGLEVEIAASSAAYRQRCAGTRRRVPRRRRGVHRPGGRGVGHRLPDLPQGRGGARAGPGRGPAAGREQDRQDPDDAQGEGPGWEVVAIPHTSTRPARVWRSTRPTRASSRTTCAATANGCPSSAPSRAARTSRSASTP